MSKREDKAIKERGEAELAIDPEDAVTVVLNLATYLGAQDRWGGSGMLEGIASTINGVLAPAGLPACDDSDQRTLKYWRRQADQLGIEHDGD